MMEHNVHKELLTRRIELLVVGCGSLGTAMTANLPNLHRVLIGAGHPAGMYVTVMDSDTVSQTSCRLQPYRASDIGAFRSVLIVDRVNAFWNLDWHAIAEDLFEPSQLAGFDVVISCAPTSAARAAIASCASRCPSVHYWLDLAWASVSAQFVLGEPANEQNRNRRRRLPVASELFPDLITGIFDDGSYESSQLSEWQAAFIGQTLTNHALMLIARLFIARSVSYHGGAVGARGELHPLRIVPRSLQGQQGTLQAE